jgi:hypothetical protein
MLVSCRPNDAYLFVFEFVNIFAHDTSGFADRLGQFPLHGFKPAGPAVCLQAKMGEQLECPI